MKQCIKCNNLKDLDNFHKRSSSKDGHINTCKLCKRTYDEEYRKNNKIKIAINKRNWIDNNKEHVANLKRTYQKTNPHIHRSTSAKRRLQRRNRTLMGYDIEIKEIYKNCPNGMEVDHIVPLNGIGVSGLHVPWNLQYLTPEENRRKSNSYGRN